MFIGTYYHRLEEQGRISLPKKFREQNQHWVITRGLDGGLFLLQAEQFQTEIEKIAKASFHKKKNRDLLRYMTNEASEIEADDNGRVYLPKYLIDFAQLQKEVVVVGSGNYLEVWDRDLYHQYIDKVEKDSTEIADGIEPEERHSDD